MIRNYRVWFKVFDSFGNEIASINECPELTDIIEKGMIMPAYTAADALEQARLEGPIVLNRLPTFINVHYPLQVAVCKLRPEREAIAVGPDYCPHLPPCRGQCEGFPIESPQHG